MEKQDFKAGKQNKQIVAETNKRPGKGWGVMKRKERQIAISVLVLCALFLAGCQQAAAGGNNEEAKRFEAESPGAESYTTESDVVGQPGEEAAKVMSSDKSSAEPMADTAGGETSEDARLLEEMVAEFYTAYFEGDADTVKSYLTDPYLWDVEVYDNPSADVEISAVKGLENINDKCIISVEYKEPGEDCFLYLTMNIIGTEEGWKVEFYGIEG